MPGKLLLIADQAHAEQLRAEADLAESWWIPATAENLLNRIEDTPPWIRTCSHELISADSLLDDRDRAEFINSLLDGTICYLAVVDRQSYHQSTSATTGAGATGDGAGTDAEAVAECRPPRTLAQHADWYSQFREGVQRWAKARAVYLRHVLILVCCDDPPNELIDDFQQLVAGEDDQRLFDIAYVMLEDLEPGSGPRPLFHAEHVWPIAAGDLLLKLLHDSPRPRRGPTRAYAWRTYLLTPDLNASDLDRLCAAEFDALNARLFGDVEPDRKWELTRFTKFKPYSSHIERVELPEPKDDGEYAGASWLDSPAVDRLKEVKSPTRWERSLREAGDEVGRHIGRQAIGQEPASCREVQEIWKSVHADPRFLYSALADRDVVRGPPLDDQFEHMKSRWEEILRREQEREDLIHDTAQCAAHLDDAKDAYATLPYRLAAIGAVTLFVGYLAMWLVSWLLDDWGPAVLAALASAGGAVVLGLLTMDREGAAGRRGKRVMENLSATIDRKMKERHDSCQTAVEDANVFWQQLWASAAAERLKMSLRRVQCMVENELRYLPPVEAQLEPDTGDDAAAERSARTSHRPGTGAGGNGTTTAKPRGFDTLLS